tara:strand:- start:6504 stop:6926 length:423 start_codon:yes stop_codon:yes gene_type:complete
MVARTTRTLVAEIIELDVSIVPNDAAMLPFITVANELVTEVCTTPAGPKVAYTAARLELIERWLTAHFYTNRDPRTSSESAGVSASYQSKIDLGLDTSHYGQTAMRLDTNGGLSKLNEDAKKGKPKLSAFWAGTAATTGS